MQKQPLRRLTRAVCLLFTATMALALVGCGSHPSAGTSAPGGSGIPANGTPAQIQQAIQQQAVQRAAFNRTHPPAGAQAPAANPYRGHP